MLSKMSSYRRDIRKSFILMKINVSFLIKNYELLEKYNEICDNVSKFIKKEFDSKSVYNDKYLKTKIKSYKGKTNTNFYDDEVSK